MFFEEHFHQIGKTSPITGSSDFRSDFYVGGKANRDRQSFHHGDL
jgi:hypothetical protein